MREIQIQNGNRSHLFCGRTIWLGIVVRQSPFFLLPSSFLLIFGRAIRPFSHWQKSLQWERFCTGVINTLLFHIGSVCVSLLDSFDDLA